MNTSPTIGALAASLAKANLELSNPTFDKKNSHFNNGYASLAAVLNAIRQPLAKNGLSLLQTISTEPGSVTLTTSLIHASGEWISSEVSVAVPNNATAQAIGSATTYMRRYSALSLCGIAGDDDDAEEDRRDREERKPMAAPVRRDSFKPERARGAEPPAPLPPPPSASPKAPPKAGEGYVKRWKNQGCDAVIAEKVVDRGPGTSAVLFSHATDGRQWVSVPHSMLHAVKLDQACELEWDWNAAGYFEARSISKIERKSMKEPAPVAAPKAVSDDDMPF